MNLNEPHKDPLNLDEITYLDNYQCPYCKMATLYDGPRSGYSVNVICCECGAVFNILPGVGGGAFKERIKYPDSFYPPKPEVPCNQDFRQLDIDL
jgi:hypothetical protein